MKTARTVIGWIGSSCISTRYIGTDWINGLWLSSRRVLPLLFCCAIPLLVSGCISFDSRSSAPASMQQYANNAALVNWQLAGKVGIKADGQANSAYLNWTQCGDQYAIHLSGPLGSRAATLSGRPQWVTLTTPDQTIAAPSPESLLAEHLGWELPVSDLIYWVRGLPAPGSDVDAAPITEPGFTQNGWVIRYPRAKQVDNYTLPSKAIAEYPQLKITLLLKEWRLNPDCGSNTL